MKQQTVLLLLITVNCSSWAQSPWTQGINKAFVQVGFSGIFYDEVRYNREQFDTGFNFTDITLQAYTEYGITDNLDATLILPYKIVGGESKISSNSTSLSGIGNVTLGLKYKFYNKKWKVSSGVLFSANTIQSDATVGLRTGFDASTLIPYMTAGSSKGKFYYFGNVGYGYMTNNYSDFLKAGLEAGYNFWGNAHVITVIDVRKTVTNESFFENDASTFINSSNYLDRQEFYAFGIKLNYEFVKEKYGLNISGFGAFDYDNSPAAAAYNVGLYYKL